MPKTSPGIDVAKVERLNDEARANKGTIVRHCREPSEMEKGFTHITGEPSRMGKDVQAAVNSKKNFPHNNQM